MTETNELTPGGSKFSRFLGNAFSSTNFTSRLLVLWTGSLLLYFGLSFSGMIELSKRTMLPNAIQLMDQDLELVSLKMRSDLDASVFSGIQVSKSGFKYEPKQIGLPRLPKDSEVFAWKEGEKLNFVSSLGSEGELRTGKWLVPDYLQKMDEKSSIILVTSFGEVLWSNANKSEVERIRKEMASLFRSGLLQASRLNKKEDGLRGFFSKISFHESVQNLVNTNIYIYRSTPIPAIMSPIFSFLGRLFTLLFAASLVTGMLSWVALNGFFHPIRTLSSWSRAVVRGGKPLPPPRMPHWSLTAESKEQMMILLQATQELQRMRLQSAQWQKVWGGMVETGARMVDAKSIEYAKQVMHSYLAEVSQFDKQVAERSFHFLNRVGPTDPAITGFESTSAPGLKQEEKQNTPKPKIPAKANVPLAKVTPTNIKRVEKKHEMDAEEEQKTVVSNSQSSQSESNLDEEQKTVVSNSQSSQSESNLEMEQKTVMSMAPANETNQTQIAETSDSQSKSQFTEGTPELKKQSS